MDESNNDLAVRVEALHYRYGAFEAVRDVHLAALPGELLAVLGTNGAGKTTTLEVLQGIRPPQTGTVRVLGMDPYRHRRRLAGRIGVMFQDSALPDELTPTEVLEVWHHLTGGRADQPPATSLEQVDLAHRSHVRIARLSGGERRRLDLAVALSADPDLLFLDEPTAGLDPESRATAWRLVRDLLRRGTTIVLTTHYLEEAEALADRIAILHRGRVEVAGTLEEVVVARRSRIQARIPDGSAPPREAFAGEVSITPTADGKDLQVRTHHLTRDLRALLEWSEGHSSPLQRLRASEASLEEIFHDIVEGDNEEVVA